MIPRLNLTNEIDGLPRQARALLRRSKVDGRGESVFRRDWPAGALGPAEAEAWESEVSIDGTWWD